jgi:nucleotide-binding universal stress UspA family protein
MSALGIRTIIVATDLSDKLIPAVQTAAALAQLADADLHVVHTTDTPIADSRLTDFLHATGIQATRRLAARILVGPPGALIVQDALRLNADVIVFGPHRPGRSDLGSTTHRVLLRSRTPCLMLPARLNLPLARVLAPVDLATTSRSTLEVALTWASAFRQRPQHGQQTEVIALHVSADQSAAADAQERLSHAVDNVRSAFLDAARVNIRTRVAAGTPAARILDVAQDEAADLIVMGTRERDTYDAALGSVSRDVVTNARHPVLLVPTLP